MHIAFEVQRTIRSAQPGKATVRLWNLTRDRQSEIEQAESAQVIVEAGYTGDRGAEQIFNGELFRARGGGSGFQQRAIRSEQSATDIVTIVEARDGGGQIQGARIEQSFEPGVSVETVLRACATALGVGAGNIDSVASIAQLVAGGSTYPEGTVLSGSASRELTRILDGLDLRWSVQHGALQILRRGQPLQAQAIRLSPSTGLVGFPDVGTRGRVHATALLTPDLWPGRAVILESSRVEGRYVIQSTTFKGDSHGNEWHAEVELAP
jgi:hypothetical protein